MMASSWRLVCISCKITSQVRFRYWHALFVSENFNPDQAPTVEVRRVSLCTNEKQAGSRWEAGGEQAGLRWKLGGEQAGIR